MASNLIGNALQHRADGTPVRVSLNGTRSDSVKLMVTNAGAIPPEMMDGMLDPFRSFNQERRRKGGLGLGLYIVQQIITAHHGKVAVESAQGATSFGAELPR